MNEQDTKNLHNQEDVKPGSALEKLVNDESEENTIVTDGTGSNNPVPRADSLIIKDEDPDEESDDE